MDQKYEEGELEKGIELNEIQMQESYQNLAPKKGNFMKKLRPYKRYLTELIEKRQITGEEVIKIFPISYIFCIIIGVSYMIFEEVNWYVFSLVLISLLGVLIHYLQKRLLIKLILRLIFTALLLLTLVRKLKQDYFSTTTNSLQIQELSFMKLFLFGHIFIILNDQFGLWEIDIVVTVMQVSGIVYLSDGYYHSFFFWTLLLFPLYLFLKKFQYGVWVQKYFTLYRENAHLQQIFHDLWPHQLFVTTMDCKNQMQLQFFNKKAKEVLAQEKSFSTFFQKIKFSQFQKEASNISLGTYSKKDNLFKLLETKHRKFEEQISSSNQQIVNAIPAPQKSNLIIGSANPPTSNLITQANPQTKQIITQSLEKNKSIKLIPQISSSSQTKRHHSSLSKHAISENGVNNAKESEFDPSKRKSTNLWSDNGNLNKNTLADLEDGFQQKIDKYDGMYFYSPDDPQKCKPISVKIYYYCRSEEANKSKQIFSKSNSVVNSSLTNEYKQRFLFVQIKFYNQDDQQPQDSKLNQNSKDKQGLLKITKKFLKDINQHFQFIVGPYKQLIELMTSQQYQYNSQFVQLQQPLQVSNYDIQTKQVQLQTEEIQNNNLPYHIEYIQSSINTLIDHLRIQLNKSTKLHVEDVCMKQLFKEFFSQIQESSEKKMTFQQDMDLNTFPEKYRQDPGRIKQILHFLYNRLVTTHDCNNPKFIMKVSYVKKRTESLFNPYSLSFLDSRISNLQQQQSNDPQRKSTHQYRKSTLKQVSSLYSNTNCFVIELILKGHCNFEKIIQKQQLKDKDKLLKTIEKLSQYLGSPSIEFITESDSLLRKYVFQLKEVNPKQTPNPIEKQDNVNIKENDMKQNENITQAINLNIQMNTAGGDFNANKITCQNSPISANNLEKQIFFNPSNNTSQGNLFKHDIQPLSTPQNALFNGIQLSQTNVFQFIDNNYQDQSQQSIQDIIQDINGESQVIVNQINTFQSKFMK